MSMNHSSKPSACTSAMPGGRSLWSLGSSLDRRCVAEIMVAIENEAF